MKLKLKRPTLLAAAPGSALDSINTTCQQCGKECETWEEVRIHSRTDETEIWAYCKACDIETFHPIQKPNPVRLFRSAASGLWYENPHAAGTINAVKLNGQILERRDGEQTMPWLRRAAEWASAIHSANVQADPRRDEK